VTLVLDLVDPILPLLYVENLSIIIIFLYKLPINLIDLCDMEWGINVAVNTFYK
jgi:hypothetical protein